MPEANKHHYLNPNKIVQIFVKEPITDSEGLPFEIERGWRVVIVTQDMGQRDPAIVIDKESESECVELVGRLNAGFVKIN